MRSQRPSKLTRRKFLQGASTTVVAGVVLSGVAQGDDSAARSPGASWPNFRNGPDNRGIANSLIPPSPALLWEQETTDGCKSTPAIAGGRVYIGQLSGALQSLHLQTGEVEWTYRSEQTDDPKKFIPGFNGPVTVTSEVVLCGDEDGTLHCVDRRTGAARWTFETEGLIVGGATVVGDRVVCGSHSQFLYGVNLRTGEKLWEFDALGPINGTQAFDGDFTFVTGCREPVLYVVD
ncbi:MAG: PQQ-like beta-propeller repeat protein, partial [Planctomycetaceae bacterium]|nr:PQQ-like beta-propeller repeat protein [Planctomycetaceae bacterium]